METLYSETDSPAEDYPQDTEGEKLLAGLEKEARNNELLEAFPDAQENYLACIRYLEQLEDSKGFKYIEEQSAGLSANLQAGQEAWDRIFQFKRFSQMEFNGSWMEIFDRREISGALARKRGLRPISRLWTLRHRMLETMEKELAGNSKWSSVVDVAGGPLLDEEGQEAELSLDSVAQILEEQLLVVHACLRAIDDRRVKLARLADPDSFLEDQQEERPEN